MQACFSSPTLQDIEQFQSISVKTCRETFAADNDPIEFENYLTAAFAPEKLVQLLEDPNYHVWFLHVSGTVAGYFALRDYPCKYPVITGEHPIELERFYLDSQYQGTGLGKQMMTFCLEKAQSLGADSVWLGAWERNTKAHAFYKKQNFQIVGRHDYWVGNDCQNHFLLQHNLTD